MSENTIFTLARTLQQTNGLEQDFARMLSSLKDSIETEYLQKIRDAASAEKQLSVEHPPREVTLLRALSAFTNDNGKEQIDRMTRSLLFLHSMQHIQQNVQSLSAGNLLEARSNKGNPQDDLPSPQSTEMAVLLLTLALADQF